MMARRLLFSVLCLLSCAGVLQANDRPNVLFISVDDWNDWVGAYGNRQASTPNLDRLADRGVTFHNAHACAVYCAPSRTALMTGLSPQSTGCYYDEPHFAESNRPDLIDLPLWFRNNGYYVAGGGKLYHHMPGFIDRRGWDEYFVWNEANKQRGWHLNSWGPGAPLPSEVPSSPIARYRSQHEEQSANSRRPQKINSHMEWGVLPDADEERMADTICANWAAEMLSGKMSTDGKPFFLGFGLYAPHKPNFVPQKYYDLHPLSEVVCPTAADGDLDDLPPQLQKKIRARQRRDDGLLHELDCVSEAVQAYLAATSYADAMVGRVLDALESGPYADNTIVVLWSDNGYHLGEKGCWAKHTLWERTSNVPFMWAGPGIASGKTVDSTVSLLDTYPTLLDLCGLPANPDIEGQSLAAVLAHPKSAEDRTVTQCNHDSFSLINQQWRYTRYGNGEEELYAVAKDPGEVTNLAENAAYAEVIEQYRKQIPQDAAPQGKGPKARNLRVVFDGESFEWVARRNGESKKGQKRNASQQGRKRKAGKKSGRGPEEPEQVSAAVDLPEEGRADRSKKTRSGSRRTRSEATAQAERPPNVLFIHVDDLDFDEVGAYDGAGLVHSPNMDRLINGGLKFTRAYVNSPVCVPSRFGTLTGRYASRADALQSANPDRELSHENINNRKVVAATIQKSEFTLARMMSSAGYVTGLIGKYHNDSILADPPIQHIPGDPAKPRVANQIRSSYESIVDRVRTDTGFDVVDRLYYSNKEQFVPESKELQVNNTAWITEGAVGFIREHSDEPFFLYYSNPIPHGRVNPPALSKQRKQGRKRRVPPKGSNNYRFNMVERSALATPAGLLTTLPDIQPPREDAIARAREHAPDGFPNNSLITWLDDSIGVLLEELEAQGLLENTLVVFQSDHQSLGKFTVYEQGARIPMAVFWKGHIAAGSVSDSLVGNIDIMATLADVCGATLPEERPIDGVSFRPLFKNPKATVRDSMLIELGYARALVTDRWKYIAVRYPDDVTPASATNDVQISGLNRPQKKVQIQRFPNYADQDQLYDLHGDSTEQENLFGKSEHDAVTEQLRMELSEIVDSFAHPFGEF